MCMYAYLHDHACLHGPVNDEHREEMRMSPSNKIPMYCCWQSKKCIATTQTTLPSLLIRHIRIQYFYPQYKVKCVHTF